GSEAGGWRGAAVRGCRSGRRRRGSAGAGGNHDRGRWQYHDALRARLATRQLHAEPWPAGRGQGRRRHLLSPVSNAPGDSKELEPPWKRFGPGLAAANAGGEVGFAVSYHREVCLWGYIQQDAEGSIRQPGIKRTIAVLS